MIDSWDQQRDEILREIAILANEKNTLEKLNKDLGLNYADLQTSISEVKGRIDELNNLEERLKTSLSTEVSDLTILKSNLESEIELKKKELIILEKEKNESIELIKTLKDIYSFVRENTTELHDNAAKIFQSNTEISSQIQNLMNIIKQSSQEIVDLNIKNVGETTIVLNKLPAMLVELQKAKLIRHKI